MHKKQIPNSSPTLFTIVYVNDQYQNLFHAYYSRAIMVLPSPFHTWEPVSVHLELLWASRSFNLEMSSRKGFDMAADRGRKREGKSGKKKKERDWFRGTTTGPSVSPPPGRPWNQLTNRGRSGNSIVRNKGKGLRNASKYHDIGTPIVGHPATSSGFLFVSTNSWRGRRRTKRRKTKRNGE